MDLTGTINIHGWHLRMLEKTLKGKMVTDCYSNTT